MAGSSLLTLLDDIATLLNDVSIMTQMAAKKAAGVLGDDLALNADQVRGIAAERELPVVWAVAKGSAVNKAILVPTALAISALAPWGILPLLMLGGTFLCYEGLEKLVHKMLHPKEEQLERAELMAAVRDPTIDLVEFEAERIKGAVRTDFVLSAEIIVITLGTVAEAAFGRQVAVLVVISGLMTVGVYGLVAAIVKLDDLGLALIERKNQLARLMGRGILKAAPLLMKLLAVVGTAAMFLVGGGIVVHGVPALAHQAHELVEHAGALGGVLSVAINGVTGVIVGAIALIFVLGAKRLIKAVRGAGADGSTAQPVQPASGSPAAPSDPAGAAGEPATGDAGHEVSPKPEG